ncbi:MAG TPA: hypothetical protein PLF13_11665 [candidate division Zixibacteria bacterium]|nr:hypothetical protein [candidate division Zixibacteria bacterium]
MHKRNIFIAIFWSVIIAVFAQAADNLDLHNLIGVWQGSGGFLMPVTGIRLDIEGTAEFVDVPDSGFIKTSLHGSKFLFNYSDSGHLWIDDATDSLTWEIWDGFGHYVTYYGVVEGSQIKGSRRKDQNMYLIEAQMIGPDSLCFRLRAGASDNPEDKAWFNLGKMR